MTGPTRGLSGGPAPPDQAPGGARDQELPGWAPRPRPAPIVHIGRFCRLEPLDVSRHGDELWRAFGGHDALWDYMAYGPFQARGSFLAWLVTRAGQADPMYFAIVSRESGKAVGLTTLMSVRPESGVIEIGHVVYSPGMQRTPVATEAVYLLAKYVFDVRSYRRLEWKCDSANAASRRAAERLGFRPEGIMRKHMVVKNRNRDTAWFSMLDEDWPLQRASFEAWLSPQNIAGAEQTQRHRLAAIRAAYEARLRQSAPGT